MQGWTGSVTLPEPFEPETLQLWTWLSKMEKT